MAKRGWLSPTVTDTHLNSEKDEENKTTSVSGDCTAV